MATRNWSVQQQAIFTWFEKAKGNLVVRARAGTGKTTTIIQAIEKAPEKRILLCAFNKRIADELMGKLRNPNAMAKTLHSVGYGLVRKAWGKVNVNDARKHDLARQAIATVASSDPHSIQDTLVACVVKLAALGKNMVPHCTKAAELVDLCIAYSCLPDEKDSKVTPEDVSRAACKAMELASRKTYEIDFDDMVWLPVRHGWASKDYGLVVVDEAQDMNQTQLELALGIASGRIAVVGDDRQAIYGFRGADSGAIDRLKAELRAVEMPLTITYRCPKQVVELAKTLVPDYSAAPTAPEGTITRGSEVLLDNARSGDFVISRLNAPLARICLNFLRNGKRARIEGRDIAKSLITLVKKLNKVNTLVQFMERLYAWQEKEVAKLQVSRRKEAAQTRIEYIDDQVATIEALGDGLTTTNELCARIEQIFSESNGPAIVCMTVHKAKGLESDRVFVLAKTLWFGGKRGGIEEDNIAYVAYTRAKSELVLVGAEEPVKETTEEKK